MVGIDVFAYFFRITDDLGKCERWKGNTEEAKSMIKNLKQDSLSPGLNLGFGCCEPILLMETYADCISKMCLAPHKNKMDVAKYIYNNFGTYNSALSKTLQWWK